IMAFFSNDKDTIAIGIAIIRFSGIGFFCSCLSRVLDGIQSGAGDTTSPMIINLLAIWLVQIPLAILLPRIFDLDSTGIWLALATGWIVQAIMLGMRVKQGRWKNVQIM
ncbi:MAG: hypothetical protein JXA42_03860, partial [Anaerolineales bacterium]|nr:hypothetical protein [Anaerolineales bacterium]